MVNEKKNEFEIVEINETILQSKIYLVRGLKVMLDVDLAEIYGYETKKFNRQVKNNKAKFEGDDFMFQLTDDEMGELSRCKNFTLNRGSRRGSNIKYNPYAFTEQGIYMLMTVLRGELAIKQSRALVRTFKKLKRAGNPPVFLSVLLFQQHFSQYAQFTQQSIIILVFFQIPEAHLVFQWTCFVCHMRRKFPYPLGSDNSEKNSDIHRWRHSIHDHCRS